MEIDATVDGGVPERLGDADVGVGHGHVLAHQRDPHRRLGRLDPGHHPAPVLEVGRAGGDAEQLDDVIAQPGRLQHQRHLVDGAGIGDVDHRALGHVTEERDLLLLALADGLLTARHDDVRLDADRPQRVHRMLSGLALELLAGRDVRDQREVDVADVAAADVVLELTDGLQEGQRLDVAHGAADLDDDDVGLGELVLRDPEDPLLDLVGDVGDDLDGPAEIVAAPLLGDHARVDAAGRDVAGLGEGDVHEALVVTEVQVGLGPVVGDEDLPVLVRRHGARVDVQVGVELLHPDVEAPGLEDVADGGGSDALAQGGDDTTGHEHELGHLRDLPAPWFFRCYQGPVPLTRDVAIRLRRAARGSPPGSPPRRPWSR